jgi:Single-strand binding protein family
MSISVLLMGSLLRAPETKTSKSGKNYAVASIKVHNGVESEFWAVLAFGADTIEALLACADGEKVALQGSPKFEASATDDQGHLKLRRSIFVDSVLTERPKPRKRKPQYDDAQPPGSWAAPATVAEVGARHAEKGADFDGDIPL